MDGQRARSRAKTKSELLRDNSSNLVWFAAIGIAALGISLAWWLLEPACPTTIEIATGSSAGQYYASAEQYREILARSGVTLNIRETAGSVENGALLSRDDSGVSLAIMQAGAVPRREDETIVSLAGLYFEPLWVFYRGDAPNWSELEKLRGRRIAIGPAGSGTRSLAMTLLHENNMATKADDATSTSELSGREAADALLAGEVDAAFFVISPRSPIVMELLRDENVHLLNFRRAEAYSRKYRYLTPVTLHEGLLDLDANVPSHDIQLLAPTAALVARGDLHPALVPLLLEAASTVHESGGYLESPGDFPSPHRVDFPLCADARRYFARGPSAFYRYLPFRWAAWGDRVKMMILPLMTLLIPLTKFGPPVYRWSIRSKIYRWYRVLREIDQKMRKVRTPDGVHDDLAVEISTLEKLEHELAEVSVPLSYMEEFYNLRLHVAFVLKRLRSRQAAEPAYAKVRRAA